MGRITGIGKGLADDRKSKWMVGKANPMKKKLSIFG